MPRCAAPDEVVAEPSVADPIVAGPVVGRKDENCVAKPCACTVHTAGIGVAALSWQYENGIGVAALSWEIRLGIRQFRPTLLDLDRTREAGVSAGVVVVVVTVFPAVVVVVVVVVLTKQVAEAAPRMGLRLPPVLITVVLSMGRT